MPKLQFRGATVQLSYSTNVHPARSLADIFEFLEKQTVRTRALVAPDRPFGVCLHLAQGTLRELGAPGALPRLRDHLAALELEVVGLNGFPLGDFHAPVVKAQAYSPDWTTSLRLQLTCGLADVLAQLLPAGGSATISTLAGSYKPWGDDFTIHERVAEQLVVAALHLRGIAASHGRHLLLGLEPEPFTTLETLEEVLVFFERHVEPAARNAGLGDEWRRYLGLNVDLCHQAVEFEELPATLDAIAAAGIPIGSVHAAAALRVPTSDPDFREKLRAFDEPRYLHQVLGASAGGGVSLRARDVGEALALPPEELARQAELRCHFHVPLGSAQVGGLPTTSAQTAAAVRHLLERDLCRQVVVETYTWGVGPLAADSVASPALGRPSLAERIAAELNWLVDAVGLER